MEMPSYESIVQRMQEEFEKQAGFVPDDASDIGIRMKVLAGELFSCYASLDWLWRQTFPQTAQGDCLDLRAAERGLQRKQPLSAKGSLVFSRSTPLAYDLAIPLGTLCAVAGQDGSEFVTIQEAVLKAGYRSVTVPAQAVESGRASNAAAHTVNVLVTPPPGVEQVDNPDPFSGGMDGEDDEAFRVRLLQSYRQVSNGTNAEFYRLYALQYEEIQSVSVVSRPNGAGSVALYVAGRGTAPSAELLLQIQQDLAAVREIGVDVTVQAAAEKSVNVSCYIKPADGYTLEQAIPVCKNAIAAYFETLGVGQPVRIIEIGKHILETGAVKNYKFYSSCVDVAVQETEVPVLGNCVVTEMKTGV